MQALFHKYRINTLTNSKHEDNSEQFIALRAHDKFYGAKKVIWKNVNLELIISGVFY
jgi:hypothetical protein